jgi:hypothetical protein
VWIGAACGDWLSSGSGRARISVQHIWPLSRHQVDPARDLRAVGRGRHFIGRCFRAAVPWSPAFRDAVLALQIANVLSAFVGRCCSPRRFSKGIAWAAG